MAGTWSVAHGPWPPTRLGQDRCRAGAGQAHGQAHGQLMGKLVQVADNRREGKKSEGHQGPGHGHDEEVDRRAFERTPAADAHARSGLDDRRKHYGKQRAHIEQDEHIADQPRQIDKRSQSEDKDDVSAMTARISGRVRHRPVFLQSGLVVSAEDGTDDSAKRCPADAGGGCFAMLRRHVMG